jgi:hypothetical protein
MSTMRLAARSGRLEGIGYALEASGSYAAAIAFSAADTLDAIRQRINAQQGHVTQRYAIRGRIAVCRMEADRPTPRDVSQDATRRDIRRVA